MTITRIDSNQRMSQASRHGNVVMLSGQISAGSNVTEQAESLFANIDELLNKSGTCKSNILHATIYLTDMKNYDLFNIAWDKWIDNEQSPSRSAIQVTQLAKPEWLVEVQVIAGI